MVEVRPCLVVDSADRILTSCSRSRWGVTGFWSNCHRRCLMEVRRGSTQEPASGEALPQAGLGLAQGEQAFPGSVPLHPVRTRSPEKIPPTGVPQPVKE
ncbi:hypothetical protein E2C01_059958 [Portunus trituberculatus]|uniref:Uncharacterized protein n=1 Tax=Portunus trituberculatus TaxID=210409 RepID=A0A5B7H6T3_PORTR|nr:hypothetical protein [Portunus trituberculatus]